MKALTIEEQSAAINMLRYLAAVAFGKDKPYTKNEVIKIIKKKI